MFLQREQKTGFLRGFEKQGFCYYSGGSEWAGFSVSQLGGPGARFSKAPETFMARKAIFNWSVSKNREVYRFVYA